MRQKEVVLRTTIKHNDSEKNRRQRLGVGRSVGEYPFEEFERDARQVLESLMPNQMKEVFGISTSCKVIRFEDGSIEILFAVVVGAVGFLSGYSGFFDSIELIRRQSTSLMEKALGRRYGTDFSVSTEVVWPRLRDPHDYPGRNFRRHFGMFESEMMAFLPDNDRSPRRDAFFWYLVGSNVALVAVIALLVWKSVVKAYLQ
jgi:hypothetical protein